MARTVTMRISMISRKAVDQHRAGGIMFQDFISWIDDYLQNKGSTAAAKAIVGIMSFAVLLGAALGSTAVKAGALVGVILLATSLGLVLLADRRVLNREFETHKKLVSHYCKLIDGLRPAYEIISWEEVCNVNEQGDAHGSTKIQIKVLVDELQFFRIWASCGWAQPSRYRRQVRLKARNILFGGQPGVSLRQTSSWMADGKLDLIIHFDTPRRAGEELTFAIESMWPGKCAPLMRKGVPEQFSLRFKQATTHAQYKIALPAGHDAYLEPVGFKDDDSNFSTETRKDEFGRTVFLFEASNPPVRKRFGVTLELKSRSAQVTRA